MDVAFATETMCYNDEVCPRQLPAPELSHQKCERYWQLEVEISCHTKNEFLRQGDAVYIREEPRLLA